jgi:hypothetical protein
MRPVYRRNEHGELVFDFDAINAQPERPTYHTHTCPDCGLDWTHVDPWLECVRVPYSRCVGCERAERTGNKRKQGEDK